MFVKRSIEQFAEPLHEYIWSNGSYTDHIENCMTMDIGEICLKAYYREYSQSWRGICYFCIEASSWRLEWGSENNLQGYGDINKMGKDLVICKLFME